MHTQHHHRSHHPSQISQPSSHSSLTSSTTTPASPTCSLRSLSSCSSDTSETTYRELQQENHSLRKRLRQDHQRFAIVLEQFRQEERSAKEMQQRLDDLSASLEEANAKLLDVLEENHELRRSFVELRRNTMSGRVAMPTPFARRQETFLEEEDAEPELEAESEVAADAEVETDEVEEPHTPATEKGDMPVPLYIPPPPPSSPQQCRRAEPLPLSPLSFTPPPSERRDAISATQDSYLARSLLEMSATMTPPATLTKGESSTRRTEAQGSAKKSSACKPAAAKAEAKAGELTWGKRLPKPRSSDASPAREWRRTAIMVG